MRLCLALMATVLLAACTSPGKPTRGPDPLKLGVSSFKLKNGLTVIVSEDHQLPVFSLYMFYQVGGKDEHPGLTGASHFLEHLMFKGTKKMDAGKFDYLVEGNGGASNAYTTNDLTVYHENMPASTLGLMLDVEADRMVNLQIDPREFEAERKVVLEERKMRYENSPKGQIYLRTMEEMFRGTPYGTSVIGDVKDLKTVSRDQIYRYYRQWYAPNNATLVIAGDVDPDEVEALVRKSFGELPASPVPEESRAAVPKGAFAIGLKRPVEIALKGASANLIFMLAYPSEPLGTARGFALDLLSSILGEGKSAFLIQKYALVRKPKVSQIYSGNYTLQKAGMFMVGGELINGVDPQKFKQGLIKGLKASCQTAVDARSLQKVKNQYAKEIYGQLDTSGGVAQFLGERQTFYGDWTFYRQEWSIYDALTVEEVRNACEGLFASPVHVWVTVWEKNK